MSPGPPPDDDASRVPLATLCERGLSQLEVGGIGVGIVTASGYRSSVWSTDDVSARIEELQVSLGEGPCVDAWSHRTTVQEPDLSSSMPGRWPAFGPGALAAGAAAVFAIPLLLGDIRLGALDLYRTRPGNLSLDHSRDALRLGAEITQSLLRVEPDGSGPIQDIVAGLDHGVQLLQASGMVSVQLDVPIDVAMARLRAYAFGAERSLREVARDVVERRLRLEPDG
jgi:hypothetical protein